MFGKIAGNKLIKNSWWDMLQQAYILLVSLFVGLASARYLGPEEYGLLGIVSSVITFFVSISWLGIDSIIINELIAHKDKQGDYIGTVIVIKIIMSIMSLVLAYMVVASLYNNRLIESILIIQGSAMLFQFADIFRFWFQSKQEFKHISISMILVKSLIAVYQIFLIVEKMSVKWFASVNLFYDAMLCGCFTFLFLKRKEIKLKSRLKTFSELFAKSYHFIISSIAITLYMQVDKLMIGKMMSSTEVGVYSAAVNISFLWQFIPMAIINASRPIIIEKKEMDREAFFFEYKRLLSIVLFVSVLFSIVITIMARPIVYILYGNDYMEAVMPLRICTWATAIAMVGVVRGIWLIANNYNKYDKYFTTIAAIVNIICNYFAINAWGIIGASVATIVSYFIEVFVVNYIFRQTQEFNRIVGEAVKEWKYTASFICKMIEKRRSGL